MDSLAAAPGTGPATSPMPVLRGPRPRGRFADLPTERVVVMGILNVTPDSFSDGGEYDSLDSAIAHGLRMLDSGVDIIDVGGESTRPGSSPVSEDEEQQRILPVVAALVKAGAVISVDTRHASTAAKAIEKGAHLINDVSGLAVTPEMISLVAATGVPYILMHNRGNSQTMDSLTRYADVVSDVIAELAAVRDRFYAQGVSADQLIIDPGLGFSKNGDQNWQLLGQLERFQELGHRILVGSSRKRFLGSLLTSAGKAAPPQQRNAATVATTALAAAKGVWGVRVHEVSANLDAAKVAARTIAASRTLTSPGDGRSSE